MSSNDSFLKVDGLDLSFNGSRLEHGHLAYGYLRVRSRELTSRSAKAATGQLAEFVNCDQSQVIFLYDYGLRSGPLRAVTWIGLSTGSREASCLSVDFLVLEVLKRCVLCVCSVGTCVWWKMEDASETKRTPSGLINLKPTSPGATS